KARLAGELATTLAGEAEVVSGRCLSYGEGVTFWPLAEIVRELAGADVEQGVAALLGVEPDAAPVARSIAAAVGSSEQAGAAEQVAWAVERLFEILSRRLPLVVVLDDLHWAEPTLLDLVEHLAAQAQGRVLLL